MKEHEIKHWAERMRAIALKNFHENGQIPPHAVFLVTRNPETGAPIEPTTLPFMPEGYDGSEGDKDKLAAFLRVAAKRYGALALIFFSEAWMVRLEQSIDSDDDFYREAYRYGSIGKHPQRVEVLMASCQRLCSGITELWTADIERRHGRVTAKPWQMAPEEGDPQGRFVGNLVPAN